MGIKINLDTSFFSYYGSYLAFCNGPVYPMGESEGLYLRSAHNQTRERMILRVELWLDGQRVDFTETTAPEKMTLRAADGTLEAVYRDAERILVGIENITLRLYAEKCNKFDVYNIAQGDNLMMLNNYAARMKIMLHAEKGTLEFIYNGRNDGYYQLTPAGDGKALLLLTDVTSSYDGQGVSREIGWYAKRNRAEFDAWMSAMYPAPEKYAAARELAGYTNWASVINPSGRIKRPSILSSKRIMVNIWNWDSLINAIASMGLPKTAQDQFSLLFDYQDQYGANPDYINETEVIWNFCKPPFHGWALRKMMQLGKVDDGFIAEMYPKLSKLTDWWMKYRDCDGDGAPEYHHGNDSGCDNSTMFDDGPLVEGPDLCALLAIQAEVLAGLAVRLGKPAGEVEKWEALKQKQLSILINELWDGEVFFGRHAITHKRVYCRSLIPNTAVIAGYMFPKDIQNKAAAIFENENEFVTQYGIATENVNSEKYKTEGYGYWRGPTWAPTNLAVIDGLYNMGREDLSQKIARRFCDTVAAGCMAENFDPLTGAPLHDKSYTWTASVFMILTGGYLG